jgi:SAM-dependent methyltransferase
LLAPRARVLDVACGSGRHARWLAARGSDVTALDRDAAALATLRGVPNLRTVQADLEPAADAAAWPFADAERFDAIVVTHYLHRPLLPLLMNALAPGGLILYETFAVGNQTVGRPSNPAFLLRPGELLRTALAADLRVIGYQDGFLAGPRAAFVQRICAVREAGGDAFGNVGLPQRYELRY